MHERAICSCGKFNSAPSYLAFCFLCTQKPKSESQLCLWHTKADSFPDSCCCKLEVTQLKNSKGEQLGSLQQQDTACQRGLLCVLHCRLPHMSLCLFLFCHRMIWDNRQTPSVPILGCFAFFFKICP